MKVIQEKIAFFKNPHFICVWLCFLLLIERVVNFFTFNNKIVDGDQVLYWLGAVEMYHGHFYEPAVYGQSYNTFFESFLALPPMFSGMAVHYALPLITNLLAVITVIFFVLLAYRHKNIYGAIAILCYFLLLPAEYLFITSMPRGFITGLCFAALGIYLYESAGSNKVKISSAAASIGFSFMLNPNMLLLMLPFAFVHVLHVLKNPKQLLFLGAGLVFPAIWQFFTHQYYLSHPDYIIHPAPSAAFALKNFSDFFTIKTLTSFYGLGPFIHFGGIVILLIIYVVTKLLPANQLALRRSIILLLIMTPLCFGFFKIHDGGAGIFFPSSRMFLALPFIFAYLCVYADFSKLAKKWFWISLPLLASVWVLIKCSFIEHRTERSIKENEGIVLPTHKEHFFTSIDSVRNEMNRQNVDTILIAYKNDLVTYGLPDLFPNELTSVSYFYERRTWLINGIREKMPRRIMLLGGQHIFLMNEYEQTYITCIDNDSLYMLTDNKHARPFEMLVDSICFHRSAIK